MNNHKVSTILLLLFLSIFNFYCLVILSNQVGFQNIIFMPIITTGKLTTDLQKFNWDAFLDYNKANG